MTARRRELASHRRSVINRFLLALMVPGIAAFAVSGRLMHQMLFG